MGSEATWGRSRLGDLAEDWKQTWKPGESDAESVDHYSIPAFDEGRRPSQDRPADIKSNKRVVAPDAVLLSRLNPSTPRVWAPALDPERESVCSTEMMVLRPRVGVNRGYLHYLCWSPHVAVALLERVSGTTGSHQRVSPRDVLSLPVPLPPIEAQRAIAEVLGALDDRIEWCGRAAALLHEFTRAAFQVWVADEGDEQSIYDVAAVEYGAPYASAGFNDQREGLPVIRIRDITADDAGMYTTERHTRDVVIEPGDIVVGMDGEFRAHAWRGPRGLLNQRVCCFRPNEGVARTLVLHGLEAPLRFYEGSITGTTVIHLGKRHIDRFTVPFSPAGNEMMVRVADPMLERAVTLAAEQRQLAAVRDALLPRLLSGELRVEDPARVLGAVA